MLTIPEIATQLIDKSLSNVNENSSRTIFLVGSKSVGKSTLLYSFLDKGDQPRETLVVEYSFARKSNQKQGIDKTLCHIWEYGGKLEALNNVLVSIPVRGQFFFCFMIDLSKIKTIWETLETCVQTVKDIYVTSGSQPELIVIGGKYDNFKNYDGEIKKIICLTLRSFVLLNNAYLLFYSSKEPQLLRRAKDMLFNVGFGNGIAIKEKNINFTKPLLIPKGSDTWESIGVSPSTMEQVSPYIPIPSDNISSWSLRCRNPSVKMRHLSRIPSNGTNIVNTLTATQQHAHPEASLDSLMASKYNELRNMELMDVSIDYLLSVNK